MTERGNHRTRWTEAEDAFLQDEWDGTHETRDVIAELLERTPDAVSQRHYELTWGVAAPGVRSKPPKGEKRRPSVSVTRRTETVSFEVDPDRVCPIHWEVRSLTGECSQCE
jgi:hypothetical protein